MSAPIEISPSSLQEGRWHEYAVRFALGGAATVFAGLVSSWYGASIGGLSLLCRRSSAPAPLSSKSMKSAACARPDLTERGEGNRPQRSTPPAQRSVRSGCWRSPECSGYWSNEASPAHLRAPRWRGWRCRSRLGSYDARRDHVGARPHTKGPARVKAKPALLKLVSRQAASEALAVTPLRSAIVLSLVFAAFSSFRLVVRKRTISSWPSSSAQAISVP